MSCNRSADSTSEVYSGSYFDLKSVVQKDISDNEKNNCEEVKMVMVNELKETKVIKAVDWKKELQSIIDADINKPAWKGKFRIDTIKGEIPSKYSLVYKPISDKIPVKLLRVNYLDGKPVNIYLVKQIQSFIFTSDQTIEYIPGKGFSVRGTQKAVLMKNFGIDVEVKYSCK